MKKSKRSLQAALDRYVIRTKRNPQPLAEVLNRVPKKKKTIKRTRVKLLTVKPLTVAELPQAVARLIEQHKRLQGRVRALEAELEDVGRAARYAHSMTRPIGGSRFLG